jgi:hypothetical protein
VVRGTALPGQFRGGDVPRGAMVAYRTTSEEGLALPRRSTMEACVCLVSCSSC